jgi:hypothetical protein
MEYAQEAGVGGDSEHPEEHPPSSSKERRIAVAQGHQRHPAHGQEGKVNSANFAITEFSEVRHRPTPNVFVGTSDRGMREGHKRDKQMMGEGTGTLYRIVVRSELSDRYAVAFEGMKMETKDGETILTGEVKDQPHLYGILDRINGLGLVLLSVRALPKDAHLSAERNREPKAMNWEVGGG